MASNMEIDDEEIELPTSSSSKGEKKRFEVKKVSEWRECWSLLYDDIIIYCNTVCICIHNNMSHAYFVTVNMTVTDSYMSYLYVCMYIPVQVHNQLT